MTKIDDAVSQAGAYMKAAEDVLASYRVLSTENKARLQQWFPTLTTALQILSASHKPFE